MAIENRIRSLLDLLPDDLPDWKSEKTIPLAEPKDLYAYIDGGAELYISYGFGEALSRTYVNDSHPDVLAEVYDLLEPKNAFGVFSQVRESENLQLGQGAYAIPGAVFFWMDRYYISLSAWEATPEAEKFMRDLGFSIEKKIGVKGNIPAIIGLLPEEGLIPFAYMYFHHYVWLNAYYFISDENLLHMDENTDAVLAKYADGDNRKYLLMVHYKNIEDAARAFDSFGREFFPEGLAGNCLRLEDNSWMAAALDNNIIVAVFNAKTNESAGQLLKQALRNNQIKQ
ncbi:MAG: hypothetical protein JW830_13790 [Bacteroidales bacterium]|nr:hypothetical protein [Bacteroidales bacterium]